MGLIIENLRERNDEGLQKGVLDKLKMESGTLESISKRLLQLKYEDSNLIDEISAVLEMDFKAWLEEHQPYMSREQIKDLMHRGFSIGSHSKDHPRFNQISEEEQKSQYADSFEFIENQIGIVDRYFSFPFSDEEVKMAFFDWMNEEGNCKLSFGVSGLKDDYKRNHLHRIPMDECMSNPGRFIKSEFVYFMVKSFFNKNKIGRQ